MQTITHNWVRTSFLKKLKTATVSYLKMQMWVSWKEPSHFLPWEMADMVAGRDDFQSKKVGNTITAAFSIRN
jgi:hypothetical protein